MYNVMLIDMGSMRNNTEDRRPKTCGYGKTFQSRQTWKSCGKGKIEEVWAGRLDNLAESEGLCLSGRQAARALWRGNNIKK